MAITIYGIKNCDTMKKAFSWLTDHGISYTFHDYRVEGITEEHINAWLEKLPVTEVVNTRSTTFKELTAKQQEAIQHPKQAVQLILSNPTMVKRPLVEYNKQVITGFKPDAWEKIFLKK